MKYYIICLFGLPLDPMTIVLKLNLDIVNMHLHTKNEYLGKDASAYKMKFPAEQYLPGQRNLICKRTTIV